MRIFALLGLVLAIFIGITCHFLFLTSRAEDGAHLPSTGSWFPLLAPISAMPQLFSLQEQDWMTEHPVISVSLSPELFPMEDQGSVDAYTGISLDFLRVISQITGLRFRMVPRSNWSDPVEEARSGRVDMFAMAEPDKSSQKDLIFTAPYVLLPSVVVSPATKPVTSLEELAGKTVAVRPDHFWQEYLADRFPHIQLLSVTSLQQGLLHVLHGKADAMVGYRFSVQRRLRASPNLALHMANLQGISGLSMAVRSELPQLVSVLEKAISHISEMERRVIYLRWLEENTRWGLSSPLFWYALLGIQLVGAGLLLVLFWNFQLRRKVEERTRRLAVELEKSARASALESLNADLRQAMAAADSAREAKGRFLANISHEIRTPLHGIISFTELAYLRNRPLQRKHQRTILDLAHTLLDIVNDVLDFSRIEADAVRPDTAPFLLDEVIRRVCDMTVHNSRARELECVVDVEPATPMALLGDAGRLQQVLANLMGNAVKFTPPGGRVHLRVCARRRGSGPHGADQVWMLFFVQDTGVGIAPRALKRLFRPFGQVDASLTRTHGGTGLGLSIARHIVQKSGGEIWVESEPGCGSTFAFSLPLRLQEQVEALSAASFVGLQALVVGASDLGAAVLARTLEALGIRAFCLRRADAAHTPLPCSPDVLVVDRLYGEETHSPALEVVRLLERRLGRTVPALLLGGPQEELAVAERHHSLCCRMEVARVPTLSCVRAALRTLLGKGAHTGGMALPEALHVVPDLSSARLLVVEDNAVNQEVMTALFEDSGAELRMACNGLEALDMLEKEVFDLVFLDIQMPGMDGYATVRLMRRRGHSLPVVGITAHSMQADKQRCLDAGMDAYLSKPFKQTLLFDTVRALIPLRVRERPPRGDMPPPPTPAAAAPAPDGQDWVPAACFSLPVLRGAGLTPERFRHILCSFLRNHADDEALLRRCALVGSAEAAPPSAPALPPAEEGATARAAKPAEGTPPAPDARASLRQLRDAAHTLKGAAANLGALSLRHAALTLEREAHRRLSAHTLPEAPFPPVLLDTLGRALRAVLEAAAQAAHEEEAARQHTAPHPANEGRHDALDAALLRDLAAALRQGAPELVRTQLDRLPYDSGPALRGTLRQLVGQVEDYDYEAALLTLASLRALMPQEGTEHAD